MEIKPQILFGKVMHGRLFPKRNSFVYPIYYITTPLSQINKIPIATNCFSAISFYNKDHGTRDGNPLEPWARSILSDYGITECDGEIILICMPRIMGYVFNPVSFWLCYDNNAGLRAVLFEVHNTFGEQHTYLCAHEDHKAISPNDTLIAQKVFHVSPFLKREGHYTFCLKSENDSLSIAIDYFDNTKKKQLTTSLNGTLCPMDKKSLNKAFWGYPLITLKAIFLIHWQALKLVCKGIRYIKKPAQKSEKISATDNLTKM